MLFYLLQQISMNHQHHVQALVQYLNFIVIIDYISIIFYSITNNLTPEFKPKVVAALSFGITPIKWYSI